MRQPNRKASRLALIAGATLVAAWVTACAQMLGDIDVERDPLQPGADPVGGVTGGVGQRPCEPGDVRCSAEGTLQVCVRFDSSAPAGWLDQYACGSPDLCNPGPPAVCTQATCQAGEVSCEGATPRVCNSGMTGWDELPACESAAHCSTDPAQCPPGERPQGAPCCLIEPCAAGDTRCNEGRLEECQADLAGWMPRDTCATQELCLSGLAGCAGGACACQAPVCEEGETRCTGATLQICNRGRTDWDVVSDCGSEALCTLGLELSPARCEAPACAPGQFVCEDAVLRTCRGDLTGFQDEDVCVGAAFCNAGAGQCDPAPCESGERSCNGAQIQVCAEDRTGFEPDGLPCATPELCNDSDPTDVRCDPPRCGVDEFNCFGSNILQVCNDGRTAFEPVGAPCLRPDLCSAERRRCDFCFPGRQECTPDQSASRVCALSGNFFGPETFCPLGCVPATGQCNTCNVGDYICSNGTLQRCNDGRSFTPLNRATDCSNGLQVSCVNGTVLRNQCGAGLSCGGTGQCLCTPGPAFCDGDDLVQCNGTAIVAADRCQGAAGNVLTTCDNGDLETDVCDDADECDDADGATCGGGRGRRGND